jgi:hypothetical protein
MGLFLYFCLQEWFAGSEQGNRDSPRDIRPTITWRKGSEGFDAGMEVLPTELARAAIIPDRSPGARQRVGMVPSPASSSEDRGHWLRTRGGCSKHSDSAGLSFLYVVFGILQRIS